MTTPAQRIEKWCWILIFLGMILLALGLSVQRSDVALGWGIAAPGLLMIVVGIVLIWIRSRMKNSKETL
jgi:sulfite exporter TauE/SafE